MLLTWLEHASFKIKIAELVIYIDPYLDPLSAEKFEKADLILISHWHYSHCTRESINRIRHDSTTILGTKETSAEILGCQTAYPGQELTIEDIKIKIIKVTPTKRKHSHTKIIGFMLETEGISIYYSSDTELNSDTPLKPTIAILPIGGSTTMTCEEAAKFVEAIMPAVVIPIHYGKLEGTQDDAVQFKDLVEKRTETKVLILKPFRELEV